MKTEEQALQQLTLQQRMGLVKRELVEGGISKNSKQKFQNYDYRGVDQVLGVISALHVKYGINVKVSRIENFNMEQRVDGKGKPVTHMTALYEWAFQNKDDAEDADYCFSIGEGMDTGDKSSGKMQSYAYKNMCFYRYEIPVSGQSVDDYDPRIDNESETHETPPDPGGKRAKANTKKVVKAIKGEDLEGLAKKLQVYVDEATSRDDLLPSLVVNKDGNSWEGFAEARKNLRDAVMAGSKEDEEKYLSLLKSAKSIADRLPTDMRLPEGALQTDGVLIEGRGDYLPYIKRNVIDQPEVADQVTNMIDKAQGKSKS